jgi:polygalacturonase
MKLMCLRLVQISLLICLAESLNIDEFGAIPNNGSFEVALINGAAFRKAVLTANAGNDRTVVISNVYSMLPSETIYNLTDVCIQLDGEILAWNGDENKWPNRQSGGNALPLIKFEKTDGLVIRGDGKIDGNGFNWWLNVILNGYDNRPGSLIEIATSKNVLVDGITLLNSPQYHLNMNGVLNAIVKNIVIRVDVEFNHSAPTFPLNTDGIDISGKDIYFTNLTIENFDDAVAVKPTYKHGSIYCDCTENILVENSYVKYGVGTASAFIILIRLIREFINLKG